jgi:ABC-2 type transport system ATP-binding protein
MEHLAALSHVWKQLDGRPILRDVSLAVEQGDIFGFLGPNGAGKTTSIRVLLGLFQTDSGRAEVLGQPPGNDRIQKRIGFVLEADGLYDGLSAHDNLAYYSQLYDVPDPERRIAAMLELAGLTDRSGDAVATFSKGMRQRLALGRAMLHDPDLLILDEPTAGVDPAGQVEIREALLNMVRERGKSVFLSSHNLDEVQRICNRVALIHRGEIRLVGELDKLERDMARGESRIRTKDPVGAATLARIETMPGIRGVSQAGEALMLRADDDDSLSRTVTLLAAEGALIREVTSTGPGLEELYLTIVREAEEAFDA